MCTVECVFDCILHHRICVNVDLSFSTTTVELACATSYFLWLLVMSEQFSWIFDDDVPELSTVVGINLYFSCFCRFCFYMIDFIFSRSIVRSNSIWWIFTSCDMRWSWYISHDLDWALKRSKQKWIFPCVYHPV